MKPVGDLNDEEEFEEECHVDDGVVFPQGWNVSEQSLAQDDVSSPQDSCQVEHQQLSRLIEFALLNFGQMQFCLDFLLMVEIVFSEDLATYGMNEHVC